MKAKLFLTVMMAILVITNGSSQYYCEVLDYPPGGISVGGGCTEHYQVQFYANHCCQPTSSGQAIITTVLCCEYWWDFFGFFGGCTVKPGYGYMDISAAAALVQLYNPNVCMYPPI